MTMRELAREFRIAEQRRREEIGRDKALAYNIATLTRAKRLPSPESWIGRRLPQEVDDLIALAAEGDARDVRGRQSGKASRFL